MCGRIAGVFMVVDSNKYPLDEYMFDRIFEDMIYTTGCICREKRKIYARTHNIKDDDIYRLDINWRDDLPKTLEAWEKREVSTLYAHLDIIFKMMCIEKKDRDIFLDTEEPDYDVYLKKTNCKGKTGRDLADKIINELFEDGKIINMATEYGEPGYTKGEDDNRIITANWNDYPQTMVDFLEDNGYDTEWSDEWIEDYNDSKLYRSSPDSYSWTPSYFILNDCEVCGKEDYFEEYLDTLINNPKDLETTQKDLSPYGFKDIDDQCHESGWYGINEDPVELMDNAHIKWEEVVFQLCNLGQFSINWKTWARGEKDDRENI